MAPELQSPTTQPAEPGPVDAPSDGMIPGTDIPVDSVDQDWTSAMVPDARRLAPNLLVAGVLPIVGYGLLRPHVGSDAVALGAVLVFPLAEIGYERRRLGHLEPIGVIALIGIVAGLAGALLLHGNDFLLKIRDSLLTGVFGVVCIATLPLGRPAMYHLGKAFATAGDPERRAQFDQMVGLPGVVTRFRTVTAVWGVGLCAEAACRVLLAVTLSTGVFLVVAQLIGFGMLGSLIFWTIRFSRRSQEKVRTALLA